MAAMDMYKMTENQLIFPDDFFLPFGGQLNKDNRWVILAGLIPWGQFEADYAKTMKPSARGQQALSVRMAFGALYIQQKKGLSDRETVAEITENPYLQYFIGLSKFQETPPFHPSMMTHFRKRLDADIINEMNASIVMAAQAGEAQDENEQNDQSNDGHDDDDNHWPPTGGISPAVSPEPTDDRTDDTPSVNQGKLLLDATCIPADITYPTDLGLLNAAREKLEAIIDGLHAPHQGTRKKPRGYRQKARKQYLSGAKQKKPGAKKIRKAIGKQLGYVVRDLKLITTLNARSSLSLLTRQAYDDLLVIGALYRQQQAMQDTRVNIIPHRIVSISQPHVRPIVRNKAKARTEFGAKVTISLVDGYAMIDTLNWESYNEGTTLKDSAAQYRTAVRSLS